MATGQCFHNGLVHGHRRTERPMATPCISGTVCVMSTSDDDLETSWSEAPVAATGDTDGEDSGDSDGEDSGDSDGEDSGDTDGGDSTDTDGGDA